MLIINVRSIHKALKLAREIEDDNENRIKEKEMAAMAASNEKIQIKEAKMSENKNNFEKKHFDKTKKFNGKCFFCNLYGHSYNYCRKASDDDKKKLSEQSTCYKKQNKNLKDFKSLDSLNSENVVSTSQKAHQ